MLLKSIDENQKACSKCEGYEGKDVGGWELHNQGMDDMEIHYVGFNTPHMHNLTELVQKTLVM